MDDRQPEAKLNSFTAARPIALQVRVRSPLSRWVTEFDHELKLLEQAYRNAIAEMLTDRAYLTSEGSGLDQEASAGVPHDVGTDELDQYFQQRDVDISGWLYDIDTTVRLITEAFIIALWHFWERRLLRAPAGDKTRDEKGQYAHCKSFAWLKDNGCAPDGRQLGELKLLAETLKHHFGKCSRELYERRPDLFIEFDAERIEPSSYQLDMTPQRFDEYLDVVRRSGPINSKAVGYVNKPKIR